MTVESVTYISDLNATYPANTDQKSEGDDHIRNIKTGLGNSFPNFAGAAMNATEAELNVLAGVTAGTAAANKAVVLDGSSTINALTVATLNSTTLTGTTINASTTLQIGGVSLSADATEINNICNNRTVSSTDDVIDAFPSGTLMLFQQTAAPTGWTKQVTHNDKALRVVTGTAGSGGSSGFTTVFGKTATDSHTLTAAQSGLPAHTHTTNSVSGSTIGGTTYLRTNDPGTTGTFVGGGVTGGAQSASSGHTHNMDIRVQYVDVIIASKD